MGEYDDPDFDENFDMWMSAAIEYERLKKNGKPIPKHIQYDLDWPNRLSDRDYQALLH